MLSKTTPSDPELFRSQLTQILNLDHPLCRLAESINWSVFEEHFGPLYHESKGRPAKPIRLLVGLTYLSRIYDVSDEGVVEGFLENPYWQYFCGFQYFQHRFPLNPTSLVKWRKRVGPEGIELLLKETLSVAKRQDLLSRRHLDHVNVDTTVQEKAIAFPTDAKLYHRMRERLVSEARRHGVDLRQSYKRLGKHTLARQGRYAHARQMRRAGRETKKLKTFLGRVVRDIRRKVEQPDRELSRLLGLADRLLAQQKKSKHKLYSVHAPEVECIAKGKAHKRYEFGCKVSVASTSRDNWVVGVQALHGAPYDGHTLEGALRQVEELTGWPVKNAHCDDGYRGHGVSGSTRVQVGSRPKQRETRTERLFRRRRAAVEPVIGHMKHDHRMERNHLQGEDGDRINAMLSGCGRNLRKLMAVFFLSLAEIWIYLLETAFRSIFDGPKSRTQALDAA